ncbi:MAG: alkaline phosphatase D family protein, partial [Planctomycetota bacterium]|nr:alkaline phosphatase D family protein [Planctomycetota bacterium]
YEIATDETMKTVVKRGRTVATPQLGHSVHVELRGLKPNRWYWYRFTAGDAQSRIGRARTTPWNLVLPRELNFAFVSCQHYEYGLFTGFEHMAKEKLDLVVHLGDYIYEYAGADGRIRKHTGPEITTLDHYRNRYGQYQADPQLQAAHAHCPWLVTWDDHEFDNDYATFHSEEPGVKAVEFMKRRANAYQAYYEHMPLRRSSFPSGPFMQLYRRVRFGRLADFAILDTRQHRTPQANGNGLKPLAGEALSPKATILGGKQEAWLRRKWLESKAEWNVMAQQVLMARVDRLPGPPEGFPMDKWAGYEVCRQRVMQSMADLKVPNPVVLTGDIHSNWVCDLPLDYEKPDKTVIGTEFVCTSISSGGNGPEKLEYTDGMIAENPWVKLHNAERGYVRCRVTPEQWTTDFQVVEDVTKPGGKLVTRHTYVVESGQPGAQKA